MFFGCEQKIKGFVTALGCLLINIPFSSTHHIPPPFSLPHQYHLLPQDLSSSHPLSCPELLGPSWLTGQQGSGACDSLVHAPSSLSWPQSCSITFSPSPPCKHSSFCLIIWPTFPLFLPPSLFVCFFACSSCSWMAYWLGFLFTFTHILPLSPNQTLSFFFCSPVYCNAQTCLICVFVSVYLLLS